MGDESLAAALPARGAVVLRSFGKTYGLAGLRLGFALASPDIAPPLRAALGPWPVSGPAIAIGIRALGDSDWLAAMRARLGKDRARLDALLHGAGWRIIGGTRLFRLAAHEDARVAFERLLEAGILARPFADAPDLASIRDAGRRERVGKADHSSSRLTRLPSGARRIKGAHGPSRAAKSSRFPPGRRFFRH